VASGGARVDMAVLRDLAHNRNEASCRSREGSGRSATCNIMLLMVDDDKVQ